MDIARDLFAFIARLAIGIVLIAHGVQKFFGLGMPMISEAFGRLGIPLPTIAAWFTVLVEIVGGTLLVLGLLLPIVGVLVALLMAGAAWFVHLPHGLFSPNGYELVLVIGVAALALGFNGGRWSIDHGVLSRFTGRRRPSAAGDGR
ncbi:DoxX family protein [Saccharopolyspora sp. NFXS83]|uniref:DoxX family protein n=1 Tax=Saccharopolyspora sp. NFXS83 TaxID=2993560 RepID=UPI00224B727B|nr:DoxX family protein [Saccharopolyspora sp. NFXS83]MCX2730229.1 DoxX family protein [Saccharopolyspora sp. NFXS83]